MKKFILLLIVLISTNLLAQTNKDSLMNKMVKEACDEINKKDLSKINTNDLEMEMGMMLMPVITNNITDIEKLYGTKITDQKGMRTLGEQLGMRLVMDCPTFMDFTMQLMKVEKSNTTYQKTKNNF